MTPEEYLAQQREQQHATAKRVAFLAAHTEATPDQHAEAVRLGNSLGISPSLAGQYRDVFAQRMAQSRNEMILTSSPRLTGWMLEGENAKVASDDLVALSAWEQFSKGALSSQLIELRGVPAGTVKTIGGVVEGTGQLLTPVDPKDRMPIVSRIAGAGTRSPEEIAELRRQIFQQGEVNPTVAQSALSGVLAGDMTPDEAYQALEPLFEPALRVASQALQAGGESTQDFASGIFPAAPGMEDSFGRGVGEGLGSFLAILGVGLLSGPAGAGIFGALGGAGEAAGNARRAGQDEDTQTIAAVYGLLPGLTDAIPVERLLSNPVVKSGFASFLRSMGKQAALEGGQEAVQQVMQNLIAQNLYAPDKSAMEDVANSFATGGVIGAIVEAGRIAFQTALPGRVRGLPARAREAEGTKATIDQIGEMASASKLRQRLDTSFMDFVEKVTDGTPIQDVYIPAEKMQELFQSYRYDPTEFLSELPGVDASEWEMALATGGDIRIPTATYAAKIAGMEIDAPLREHMRFDPQAMTFAEAQAFNERAAEIQQQAFEEAEAARLSQEAERALDEREYDELVGRLRAAGRATDIARFEAMPIIAMRRTMAERSGLTPEEFAARNPLPEIRGEVPEGLKTKQVDELTRQLAELRAYIARPAKKGPSLLEAISDYGGINDVGGELKARDAAVIKRGRGQKRLRLARGGVVDGIKDMLGPSSGRKHGIDDVAQAMIEAGYLQNDPVANEYRAALETGSEAPDIGRALLAAIDEELRGNIQYSGNVAIDEKAARYDDDVAYLDSIGVSLDDSDAVIREALARAQADEGRKYNQASLRQKLTKLRKALTDLVATAKNAARGENEFIEIAQVSEAVADLVEQQSGADIHGYRHTIDTSAIRHILKSHGDARSEEKRGMVAVTEEDLLEIPDLISAADKIVTGAKGKRGEDLIGYLKKMDDGTTLYIEEARRGRKALAAVSMRKYPATSDYSSIAKTISPNVRNDGGNGITITDLPDNSKTLFQRADGPTIVIDTKTEAGSLIVAGTREGMLRTITPWDEYNGRTAEDRLAAALERVISEGGKVYAKDRSALDDVLMRTGPIPRATPAFTDLPRQGRRAKIITRDDIIKTQGRIFYQAAGASLDKIDIDPSTRVNVVKSKLTVEDVGTWAEERKLAMENMRGSVTAPDGNTVQISSQIKKMFLNHRGNDLKLVVLRSLPELIETAPIYHTAPDNEGRPTLSYAYAAGVINVDGADYAVALRYRVDRGERASAYQLEGYELRPGGTSADASRGKLVVQPTPDRTYTVDEIIEKFKGNPYFQDGRRGAIQLPFRGAGNSPAIISLFQNANLSTFLHESGHYFLYVLEDMATPPGVSPEIVEMYSTVKAWWRENAEAVAADAKQASGIEVSAADVVAMVDAETTGDAGKDAAIVTGMHEQFARGFEAYLMEGKAPSIELRPAFERFAQWLLRLYRSLRGLNVNVSPELRAVFDRMLASDAEIEAARSDLSDEMLFAAAEAAGVSPDDYRQLVKLHEQARDEALMKLRREVMVPLKREREQWFKDERAKVKTDVTERMQAMPVYRAIQELRFGKDFDGNPVTPMKLDRAIVEKEFGGGHIPFLPGATRKGHGHMNAVFGSNGVHPDIVAGMYGFQSGRDLLNEMENAVSIREAIEQETERIMFERHGDVLNDGSLEAQAIEAMHGDKRGQFLAAELNVLNRKVGGKKTTSQEAREAVRRTIRTMKVRDASAPRRYLAAERKAASEAAIAVARGDMQAAAEAKRRQLLNYHFYMEASATAEEVDGVIERMRKLNKPDHRLSKTRDVDYVKAARAIAGQFGLARAPSEFDMAAWLEQLKVDDEVSYDSLSQAIYVYSRGGQQSYRNITVAEFNDVKDAIDNLMETGKLAREAEIDGKKVELHAIRDELMQIASSRSTGANTALSRRLTKMEKIRVRALSLLAALRRVEAWARDMDDGQAGAYVRYIVNPVMDSLGVYRQDKARRLRELLDIIEPRKDDLLGASIYAPELNYTFENKGELLHAILHTGNDSNRRKLLVGRNWKDGWDGFIQRMHNERIVTKADYDTAQAIWDLMEEIKRPAQSAHRRMYGFYFQEIQPTPLETPFGQYKGGYVPAIVDGDASVDGTLRADQQALEQQNSSAMFPTTGRGFTKSRSEGYATPLALDLMMIPAHMDKVLRFTHLNPAIRQTARIVNNAEFRIAMNEVSPGIVENMIIPWLQRTAMQAVEARPTTPAGRAMSAVAREIRRRVGVHTMFLNVVNTVQQVTGFSSALVLVKPGRLKAALVRFARMGEGNAMREEASALSLFMDDRIKNSSREMHGRIQEAIVKPGKLGLIQSKANEYGYVLQQGAQNVIDVIVWHAAYDQAVANGMDQADAVREADSVIRRTMGSFAPEDVSVAETGNAFVRLFTMFYSYFNGQTNLVGGELQTVMRTYGYNGASRMFAIYMFGIAIPAIVGEAIVQAARGDLGDDDDDGYVDDIASLFFGSQVRYAAGMVPVAGQTFNAFINTWNDKPYDDRLSTSPAVPALERVIRAPVSIYSAVVEGRNASRGVQDGIVALGLILGIPTGQLVKTAGYAVDVSSGRQSPESAADVLQGIVSGRDGTGR